MSYDSRPETKAHIERVGHFIGLAVTDLRRRRMWHDDSKLAEPELSAFDEATPKLAQLEYGSEEYKASLRELKPALEHHFEHNDHHAEHFANGVNGMTLMAVIEMLCDWRAASERTKQRTDDPEKVKSFESGLQYNYDRFGIEPQLAEIMTNTARALEMLE